MSELNFSIKYKDENGTIKKFIDSLEEIATNAARCIFIKNNGAMCEGRSQIYPARDKRNLRLWKSTAGFKRVDKKPLIRRILDDLKAGYK